MWAVSPRFCFGIALEGLLGRFAMQKGAVGTLLEPALAAKGYALVRTRVTTIGHRNVQVMVERLDGKSMTLDDCAGVSHIVSAILEAKDPILGSYQLEVSSPGIDRPLINAEDFQRYMGYVAAVTLKTTGGGQKKIRGLIVGVADVGVEIKIKEEEKPATVFFSEISDAKLVLTDELIIAANSANR